MKGSVRDLLKMTFGCCGNVRNVKLYIHPSHYIPGDATSKQQLADALKEYKRRIAGV